MTGWREVWHFDFLGNELGAWTLAFVTLLVTFTALPLAKRFISVRRRRLIGPGPPRVHLAIDLTALLVERTKAVFLWAVAVWVGSRYLSLAPRLERSTSAATTSGAWPSAQGPSSSRGGTRTAPASPRC